MLIALVTLGLVSATDAIADDRSSLQSVRFGITSSTQTRVVLDFEGSAPRYRISGTREGKGRVYVKVLNLSDVATTAKSTVGKGLLQNSSFLAGRGNEGEVVLSLRRFASVKEAFLIPPKRSNTNHRLVIDFVASKRGGLLASVPERPARATATPARAISAMPDAPSLADPIKAELAKINNPAPVVSSEAAGGEEKTSPETQKKPSLQALLPSFGKKDVSKSSGSTARPQLSTGDRKFTIVLDPGHGGADPGAIGIGGTLEKDVTLSAAKSLKKHLEALGRYRVILTRSTDKWLALDQRSPIARRAEADLFLSIHADSLRSKNVRGASVYTLSDDGARRSVKVAEEDNELVVFDVDLNETDPVVRDILFDLAHEDTGKKSDLVAELMIGELGKTVPLLKNTHRREDLRVLLAPDLPSVLVELGFLSNQEDEKNLKSEAWRVRATKALARAIDAYFDEMGKDRHASVLKKSGG